MEGLKTTEIYFLVVLEARSLPSVLAGLFLLEAQSENPPLASLLVPGWLVAILGVPWLIDSSLQSLPCLHVTSSSVCYFPFYNDTCHFI